MSSYAQWDMPAIQRAHAKACKHRESAQATYIHLTRYIFMEV